MKKHLVLLAAMLILFPCLSLRAVDVGLILDQTVDYSGSKDNGLLKESAAPEESTVPEESAAPEKKNAFEYSGALIPWFSAFSGNNGSFYFSASVRADWKNETLSYLPEFLRTEFSWRSESGEFKLGRMQYTDSLGYIATGLFDGAYISLDTGGGSVGMGAWYTGLLSKDRANITMTQEELDSYNTAVDYKNFKDTYFAPRRVVSALEWEHPGLVEQARVKLALLGQFDLARENAVNSQYLTGKISIPINDFVLGLGGCLEAIEFLDEYKTALAAEVDFIWMFTVTRLSLSGRYSGGVPEKADSKMTAFVPLSTVYQGDILKAKFSGLSVVVLDYLCRIHRTFSANLAASCFMRSDLGTYNGYPITTGNSGSDNYILGTELFGRFLWAPVSDIQINMGGGAFLPTLGNVDRDASLLWRAEANLILVLY